MAWLIEKNWWRLAACRSIDPELFFPVSTTGNSLEQVAEAKAVCARCLVRRQCLAFALRTRQAHGIWGGRTTDERLEQRTARIAAVPAANGAEGGDPIANTG